MKYARAPHRFRTIAALVLVAGAGTVLLAGCSNAQHADGAYVEIGTDGGVDSVWVLEGDSARFANATCDSLELDLHDGEPGMLSKDRTQIKSNQAYDDTYQLVWFKDHPWYADGSGFAWDDRGDFVRDDSDAGKAAVEKWETACDTDWPE